MTEKRFKFDRDTVATNLKTPIIYDEERMSIGEVLDKLNELHEKNKRLKQRSRIRREDHLETLNDLKRAYENNKKALNNIERLEEENEMLKEQVGEMIDIFNNSGLDYHISDELEEILND